MWEYKSICDMDSSDVLQHWKYIKKKKNPDGTWRYYYSNPGASLYEKVVDASYKDKDGGEHRVIYKQTDKLFSDKEKVTWDDGKNSITVKKQGKLERARARGEKFVFDLLYKDKSNNNRRKMADVDIPESKPKMVPESRPDATKPKKKSTPIPDTRPDATKPKSTPKPKPDNRPDPAKPKNTTKPKSDNRPDSLKPKNDPAPGPRPNPTKPVQDLRSNGSKKKKKR